MRLLTRLTTGAEPLSPIVWMALRPESRCIRSQPADIDQFTALIAIGARRAQNRRFIEVPGSKTVDDSEEA